MKNFIHRPSMPLLMLAAVVWAFLHTGCDVTDGDRVEHTYTYHINRQAAIDTDTLQQPTGQGDSVTVYPFSIEEGSHTVFRYRHNSRPPKGVIDGGLVETLVFQVPSGTDKFEYRGDTLGRHSALYRRSCYCPLSDAGLRVTGGVIRGEKLSAVHWIIHAEVTITGPTGTYRVRFEAPFYVDL